MKRIIIIGFIFICEVVLLFSLDKINYLNKGTSIRTYNILPFNTKIQGDQNCSGYYYFHKIGKGGLELTPNLIFQDEIHLVPTVIYREFNNNADTIFIKRIICYGYNKNELVIKVADIKDLIIWLKPCSRNESISLNALGDYEIETKSYRWVTPMSGYARIIMLMWIIFLVLIPLSCIYELYLICYFFERRSGK